MQDTGLLQTNVDVDVNTDASSGHVTIGIHDSPTAGLCIEDTEAEKANPGNRQHNSHSGMFVHDVALTMAAEIAVVAAGIFIVSILSRWVGAHQLSEYLLFRRVVTWMVSGLLLGLANGLPRYVAQAAGRQEQSGHTYFLATLSCAVPFCALIGLVLVTGRDTFARWLFGGSDEWGLIVALALMLLGFAIHRAVYGYYRGLLAMTRANALEVCNLALMPLVIVVALHRTRSIALMVEVMGGLTILLSMLFSLPLFQEMKRPHTARLMDCCRELLRYGVPRVPGECGVAAITALGPILAAHYLPLTQVLPLLLGLNVLLLCGYASGPLGNVLLSKVSMMLGEDRHQEVRSALRVLLVAVIELSVFICIQAVIFIDVVLHMWVGPSYSGELTVIRLVLLSIPSYLLYMTLRSTIDAVTVKPCNTANVSISLLVYFVLIAGCVTFLPNRYLLVGLAAALLCTQVVLGSLTARTFRQFYGVRIVWAQLAPSLLIALAFGVVAYALRLFWRELSIPGVMIAFEAALTAVYLRVLYGRGSDWIEYIRAQTFRNQVRA